MIDVSEEVIAPVQQEQQQPVRRRSSTVTTTRAPKGSTAPAKKSLNLERVFSDANVKPFDQIEWEQRTAEITDDAGKIIFK